MSRSGSGGNGHGSEDLLYRGWRNIRDSGAGAFVAELDWCRRHGSLELFRIAARYASLIG
jgi:hypothetical protein